MSVKSVLIFDITGRETRIILRACDILSRCCRNPVLAKCYDFYRLQKGHARGHQIRKFVGFFFSAQVSLP